MPKPNKLRCAKVSASVVLEAARPSPVAEAEQKPLFVLVKNFADELGTNIRSPRLWRDFLCGIFILLTTV